MANKNTDAKDEQIELLKKQIELLESKLTPELTRPLVANPTRADIDEFKGKYKHRQSGEVYGLRLVEANSDNFGRSHQLANNTNYIECTEDEFRLAFDKI